MIKYIQYNDAYFDRTIDFLKREWKSINTDKWEVYFFWKYINNPYTCLPNIFVAVDRGDIIGFRAIFVQKFSYDNTVLMIGSGADARIAESYRGRGVYRALVDFGNNYCDSNNINYLLNLTSNKNSTPILMKLGWRPVRVKREMLRIGVNTFYPFYRKKKNDSPNYYKYRDIDIEEWHGESIISNEVITALVESNKLNGVPNKIHSIRDSQYYTYKLSNPVSRYFVFLCRKNGELAGHFIIKRLFDRSRVVYSKIIDYQFKKNDAVYIIKAFLKAACSKSELLKNTFITVPLLTMDGETEFVFKHSGFLKEGRITDMVFGRTALPSLVRPTKLDEDRWYVDYKNIQDYRHWHLTGIDADNA
jgi:hypothetical protein